MRTRSWAILVLALLVLQVAATGALAMGNGLGVPEEDQFAWWSSGSFPGTGGGGEDGGDPDGVGLEDPPEDPLLPEDDLSSRPAAGAPLTVFGWLGVLTGTLDTITW